MQATITYLLTEQAQRAQMVATGQPVARKQVVTVEVTGPDLELMAVAEDGTPYLDIASNLDHLSGDNLRAARHIKRWYESYNLNSPAEIPTFDADVLALIRDGRTARQSTQVEEKAKAEERKRQTKAYSAVVSDWVITSDCRSLNHSSDVPVAIRDQFPLADYSMMSITPVARQAIQDRYNEVLRIAKEKEVAKVAKEAALEDAKSAFIAEWLAGKGPALPVIEGGYALLQQQNADGLLCRKDAVHLIADAVFADAGVPEVFRKADFCDDSKCECGETIVDCLPRSKYPAWAKIKSGLPKGYSVEFSRYRECLQTEYHDGNNETAGPAQYLAEISIPHGPFTFTRTIEL